MFFLGILINVFFSSYSQIANEFLCDPYGQEALKALYRFVSYNSEWLQRALGVTAAEPGTTPSGPMGGGPGSYVAIEEAKLVPWSEKTFKEINVHEMMEAIGE